MATRSFWHKGIGPRALSAFVAFCQDNDGELYFLNYDGDRHHPSNGVPNEAGP